MKPEVPKSQAVRAGILEAAAGLFAEHGYAGASMDEISRRAGVNKAMLYYYIGDKAELFASVLEEYMGALRDHLEEVIAQTPDPEERIRRMQSAILAVFSQKPWLPGMVIREIVAGGRHLPPRGLAKLAEVIGITFRVIEDGKAKGAFRDVNPMLMHVVLVGTSALFVNALRLRERLEATGTLPAPIELEPGAVAAELSDIILYGVAKPKKSGGKK